MIGAAAEYLPKKVLKPAKKVLKPALLLGVIVYFCSRIKTHKELI